jgi:hypothetical protein
VPPAMVAAPNLLTPRKWPTGPRTIPTAPADTFTLALRIEKSMPPRQRAGPRRGKSCPTAPLARLRVFCLGQYPLSSPRAFRVR